MCQEEILKQAEEGAEEEADYFELIESAEEKQLWSLWNRLWVRVLCEVKGYCELSSLISENRSRENFMKMANENKFDILNRNPTFSEVLSS